MSGLDAAILAGVSVAVLSAWLGQREQCRRLEAQDKAVLKAIIRKHGHDSDSGQYAARQLEAME